MASIGVDAVWHFGAVPSYVTYFHMERKAVLANEVLRRVSPEKEAKFNRRRRSLRRCQRVAIGPLCFPLRTTLPTVRDEPGS